MVLSLIVALGPVASARAGSSAGAGAAWPTAEEALAELGPGVNLGNGLEAPSPGEWGVVVDEALLDAVVSGGFEAVRLPVRFNAHALADPPYTLDPAFMAMVDGIISAATDRGLVVIVDLHHYDELHADPAGQRARFLAIWEQLASRYADRPPSVWFELLNEPQGSLDPATWNTLASDALAVVRQTNPQRIVVVGAALYSHARALQLLDPPRDPYVAATFHTYDPFPFTHQGASWVPGSDAWLGTRWTGTQDEIDALHSIMDAADAFEARTGVPVLLGEYGAFEAAPHQDRVVWTDAVGCAADAHGIPAFYWELASGFGFWDVPTQTWDEALRDAVLAPRERSCVRSALQTSTTTAASGTAATPTGPASAPRLMPAFTG